MDTTPGFCLVPLPCGCVAEFADVAVSEEVFLCPWCGATTTPVEYKQWLVSGAARRPHMQDCAPPLLRRKSDCSVLEVAGQCGCGSPIVREPGGQVFHLGEEDAVELRN